MGYNSSVPRFLLPTCALLLAACGSGGSGRPATAVKSYVRAIRSADYDAAYRLMSDRYRKEHTREQFIKMMSESPEDVRQTAERLSAGGHRVEVSARFVYDDLRDEITLVEEGGTWKLATNPLDFYPQDTPARTVRSFVRAIELQRWDVVMRFVPNKYREHMSVEDIKAQFEGAEHEDVGTMVRVLTANLDNNISQQGDEARMQYGDRYEIKLIREDGMWKVEDPG